MKFKNLYINKLNSCGNSVWSRSEEAGIEKGHKGNVKGDGNDLLNLVMFSGNTIYVLKACGLPMRKFCHTFNEGPKFSFSF